MSEAAIYVFVYGTLRRTCSTGAHKTYLQGATFIGDARIQAKLFRVSYYPAIILSNEDEWVNGEVYRLVDEAQLHALDDYEECSLPANNEQEYRREQIRVKLTNGEQLNAWAYIYNRSTENLTLIAQGNFL